MTDTQTMYAVLNTDTLTFIKQGSFGGHLFSDKSNLEAHESHLEIVEVDIPIEHAPFI